MASNDIGNTFKVVHKENSYHAGAGLEVSINDSLALSFEYLLLVPSAASATSTVADFYSDEITRFQRGEPAQENVATPQVSDFINPNNFRLALGARYYF